MMRLIPILALALCLGAFSDTLAQRLEALKKAPGVIAVGHKAPQPLPGGLVRVNVEYVTVDGSVASSNRADLLVRNWVPEEDRKPEDPVEEAFWMGGVPVPLLQREEEPTVGDETAIMAVVETAAGGPLERPAITRGVDATGTPYALVTGYRETSGRLQRVEFHVRKDSRGALVAKAFDSTATGEVISR